MQKIALFFNYICKQFGLSASAADAAFVIAVVFYAAGFSHALLVVLTILIN